VQSVPAVGQVKAAEQTKKIWRKDLVLSEQRELGDSSKLPPMVVDGGARFYDGTPDIDAPDVCKCVAVGTADARRPARLVVPDVERVLVGDRYPEGRTEESNSRSVWIADPGGSNRSVSVADLSGCGEGVRVGDVRQLSLAAFSFPSPADAPDDMRRHPPAQAPAEACSAFGPIARVDGEMCEVDPAVSGLCEVDPAVSGLYEVGPAETGLARSASCRSDGGLVLEPGRKRVVVRCCLVTAVKPVGLKSTGAARERNGSEPPDRRCLFGRCGGSLLLFSLSNTITSYGDRYPEGRTEESNSRSKQINVRTTCV